MRIMLIADEPTGVLWEHLDKSILEGLDLIISCGDLPPKYLDFIVTFAPCPLFYVHGNHDDSYEYTPPTGCDCIEDKVVVYKGIRFLGIGGSQRYKDGKNQYTEKEMKAKISQINKSIKYRKGIDILVTHAPAKGLGDSEDLPHRGFECVRQLVDKHKPKYMFHGHVHMNYGPKVPRIINYNETTIVNGYRYYILDIDSSQFNYNGCIWDRIKVWFDRIITLNGYFI